MVLATEIWSSCPTDVIKNCFDHCLKAGTEKISEKRTISKRETVDGRVCEGTEHGLELTRADLESMLTLNDENFVDEKVSLEQLRREVAGVCGSESENAIIEDLGEEEDFSLVEELAVLARVKSTLERCGELCDGSKKRHIIAATARCESKRSLQ